MFHFGTGLLKNEIAIQSHPKQKNCLKQAAGERKTTLPGCDFKMNEQAFLLLHKTSEPFHNHFE